MKNKLINYFTIFPFKILDGGKPASTNFDENHYGAISFNYICKYVLEDMYPKKEVFETLLSLISQDFIRMGRCRDFGGIVFYTNMPIKTKYWQWFKYNQILEGEIDEIVYSDQMREDINLFKEYLKHE